MCITARLFCCFVQLIAACAQAFYMAGCKLVLCSQQSEELKRVKAELEKLTVVRNA